MTEFVRVLEELDSVGLEYWLDAGSLLGVIRSGALLPWDKDIDLGCWVSQIPKLGPAVAAFRRRGYNVRLHRYRGDLYQVKLRPPLRALLKGARTLDIAVFRRRGKYAWCPVNCVDPQPAPRFSVRWFIAKPLREAVIRPWENREARRPRTVAVPRLRMEVRTWVVPAFYFLELSNVEVEGRCVRIPADASGYLTRRYGAWEQPREGWNYCEDDGVIDRRPPEEVVAAL
jgi:hypothetical protein